MHVLPPPRRFVSLLRRATGRHDADLASSLLGARHELPRVLATIERIDTQLACVSLAHGIGLALWSGGVRTGVALCLGAVGLEVVLGGWRFLLVQSRRERCLALIVEGREGLPLAAIEHECRHLRSPRHRGHLAHAFAQLGKPQPFGAHPMSARPPIDARVVGPVRPQLREFAAWLADDDVSVRGVAAVERLVSAPWSTLYGSDPEALRREVGRARYLLCS